MQCALGSVKTDTVTKITRVIIPAVKQLNFIPAIKFYPGKAVVTDTGEYGSE